VVVKKLSSSVQQVRPKELRSELPDQSHPGIIDFQASFESESRKKGSAARRVSGNRIQQAIAAERKSPACEDAAGTGTEALGGAGNSAARKEQGRRRSIPQTALPAPDIEIGLRRPVEAIMPRFQSGLCDPVHNRRKKVAASPWHTVAAARASSCLLFLTAHRGQALQIRCAIAPGRSLVKRTLGATR
jgi:hypothetical protein